MKELAANALASMPMPKKAMTQTMGRLGKIRLRPSQCDFFRAWRTKCAPTSKIAGLEVTTAVSGSLRFAPCEPRSKTYAVEMTRAGKLQKRVSHRAWKSGRRRPIPTFPPRQQQHLPLSLTNPLAPHLSSSVDGCRSLRSRSIRQRRFAPRGDRHGAESLIGIRSE